MTDTIERLKTALSDRYTIERELGAGGMATVYLAHDLKHDRPVAVKVLRPELAAVLGAERFVQEIKTTANLQHPHILPLFDSGEAEGFLYYVMPFIDGETLRDKLNRETQLGIEEAVRITTEVADALDYAHRQGVIHRDIKPENILLHDGRPMVADFGIALAVSAAAGGRITETGMSLGTPHYMSPEQATADKDLTNRSDIYSLGCVIYEMLTGDPPHTGASAQAIVLKIVTDDVRPVTELRKSVPPHVAASTAKALERLAADRFATAKEFAEALTNPAFTLPATQTTAVAGAPASGPWNRLSVGLASLAAFAIFVALWGWLRPASESPTHSARFAVPLPDDHQFSDAPGVDVAFSPDGSRFVYRGQTASGAQLYVRAIDELTARPIPGTEDATQPFFSPDGQWLGFYSEADGQLKKIQVTGGPAFTIAETGGAMRGASWGANEVIVFGLVGTASGLMQVAAAGGTPEPITTRDKVIGEGHRWPEILPAGDAVVFTIWSENITTARIAVGSLASGRVTRLSERGFNPHYTASGHLVYTRSGGSVVGVPFDIGSMAVTGQAIPLLEGVRLGTRGVAELAVSRTGSLVYVTGGGGSPQLTLVMVDRQGDETPLIQEKRHYEHARFSPSGDLVAVSIDGDIWVYDVDQGTLSARTFDGGIASNRLAYNRYVTWTPDGTRLVFSSGRIGGSRNLYSVPADGSSRAELFFENESAVFESALSSDGRWLAFRADVSETGRDILAVSLEGEDRSPRPFVQTPFNEQMLALSPDGRWLAYVSDESGQDEVYVRAFPEPAAQIQVSVSGGNEPSWAPSGRELFYRNTNGMMAAAVQTAPAFRVTERERLFEDIYIGSGQPGFPRASAHYDVDPRSGRFLMIKDEQAAGEAEIVVVVNWFEEVKAKVGNE